MRFLFSILALAPVVLGDVNIPWTNCGKAGDLLTIDSVTGNIWPPKKGAEFDVAIAGALSQDINGGNYNLKVEFDSIPILDKTGTLASLNVTLPIKNGPINLQESLTFPSAIPSGNFDITVSATDENNNEIGCAEIKVTLSSSAPTYSFIDDIEFIDSESAADDVADASVPVPYTNCGKAGDLLTITSAEANVWPPVKGSEFDVVINGTLSEDITGGNYDLKASFDGIPLINKNGALSSLPNVTFPIKAGPINIAEGLTFPKAIPSGTFDITVSATDANNNEIGCINLNVKLGASKSKPLHPIQHLINHLPAVTNTPVPFNNCGSSTDLATVNSLAADIWPPKKGSTVTLFIDATAKATIAAGNYDAVISWDSIPIENQKGSLTDLGITLPVAAGPVSAKKAFSIPAAAPSGSINVKASAVDGDNNPIFCVTVDTKI